MIEYLLEDRINLNSLILSPHASFRHLGTHTYWYDSKIQPSEKVEFQTGITDREMQRRPAFQDNYQPPISANRRKLFENQGKYKCQHTSQLGEFLSAVGALISSPTRKLTKSPMHHPVASLAKQLYSNVFASSNK